METNSFIKQSTKQFYLCVLFTEYCAVRVVYPLMLSIKRKLGVEDDIGIHLMGWISETNDSQQQ